MLGIDGQQKMSKSLNNHIELAATPEETQPRVMQMVTDPQRMRRSDPGNPDVCNVFSMHKVFSSAEEVAMVNVECRRAGIGCVHCKQLFARNLNATWSLSGQRRARIGTGARTRCGMCCGMAQQRAQLPSPARPWPKCKQAVGLP